MSQRPNISKAVNRFIENIESNGGEVTERLARLHNVDWNEVQAALTWYESDAGLDEGQLKSELNVAWGN